MVDKVYRKNPKTYEDEISGVVNDIEKDQIKTDSEVGTDFDIQIESKDLRPSEFTEKGTDYVADIPVDATTEFPEAPSMSRFAKKHTVPESAKVQGQDSGETPKTAETDSPADEQVPEETSTTEDE